MPAQLSNENFITTEYDKDKIEKPRTFKDGSFRSRTLTVIGDAIKFIYETTGDKLDIDKIPLDDEATCVTCLRKGDTQGYFSRIRRNDETGYGFGTGKFEDLIPLVALYRPGPLGTEW